MCLVYKDKLDPKELSELLIHSFMNVDPKHVWRLKQMVVLYNVSEFNKDKWTKKGFSQWNGDFYNDYYTYSATRKCVTGVYIEIRQW